MKRIALILALAMSAFAQDQTFMAGPTFNQDAVPQIQGLLAWTRPSPVNLGDTAMQHASVITTIELSGSFAAPRHTVRTGLVWDQKVVGPFHVKAVGDFGVVNTATATGGGGSVGGFITYEPKQLKSWFVGFSGSLFMSTITPNQERLGVFVGRRF